MIIIFAIIIPKFLIQIFSAIHFHKIQKFSAWKEKSYWRNRIYNSRFGFGGVIYFYKKVLKL